MTPLQRFLRNLVDRWRGRYYEGPEPPPRLAQEVRMFAVHYPNATADDWKEFALRFAQNSYRDGFTRGLEWNERLWPGPAVDPEVLAEHAAHNWSLPEERIRALEQAPSPIVGMTAQQAGDLQHHLARAGATLVVVQPSNPYPRRTR